MEIILSQQPIATGNGRAFFMTAVTSPSDSGIQDLQYNPGSRKIISQSSLNKLSDNTDSFRFTIPVGAYVDNVIRIRNMSGGFGAFAVDSENGDEMGAFGVAKTTGGGYTLTGRTGYFEVGRANGVAASATDLSRFVIRQYAIFSGLNMYTRFMIDNDGSVKIFGRDLTDDFTTGVRSIRALMVDASGKVTIGADGSTIKRIKFGTATLVNGLVTVADATMTASDLLFITTQSNIGTTTGKTYIYVITPGVSFAIASKIDGTATATADQSIVNYIIVTP